MKLSGIKMSVNIKVEGYSEMNCNNETELKNLELEFERQIDNVICDPKELGEALAYLTRWWRLIGSDVQVEKIRGGLYHPLIFC